MPTPDLTPATIRDMIRDLAAINNNYQAPMQALDNLYQSDRVNNLPAMRALTQIAKLCDSAEQAKFYLTELLP